MIERHIKASEPKGCAAMDGWKRVHRLSPTYFVMLKNRIEEAEREYLRGNVDHSITILQAVRRSITEIKAEDSNKIEERHIKSADPETKNEEFRPGDRVIDDEGRKGNIVDRYAEETDNVYVLFDGTDHEVTAHVSRLKKMNDPIALAPDEKKIKGFAAKLERCVKKTKGDPTINPYAICRSALRKAHGLKVKSEE